MQVFQSTHPVRGGTGSNYTGDWCQDISIHPPRAGWDRSCAGSVVGTDNFNPPTPCGVGPHGQGSGGNRKGISIHPPRAGWDHPFRRCKGAIHISIHPPRAGWDETPPSLSNVSLISIHPPRVGWDQ